ncbi:hypothetical protein H5410_042350 [Solanum commersonii]|uniref:Uncharacterized protein n=1 Tax=Solanum commersonii TaxID=4109 RepID=A0A9J5XXC7_SOLCO|nr:hypothetical protein H5410_042350 [Solanum commersonii]
MSLHAAVPIEEQRNSYAETVARIMVYTNGESSTKTCEEKDQQEEINCELPRADTCSNGLTSQCTNTTIVNLGWRRLGKIFGIDFQGHEEEATELLMQIDSCRQARRMEQDMEIKKTKIKGAQELKSLVAFDVKFKSSGKRNRGRITNSSS